MRRLAALFVVWIAVPGFAQEAVDVAATVIAPDGKPVAGADVWLVTANAMQPPFRIVAQTKTGKEGRFTFGKELIAPLWEKSVYPEIVARDSDGRIGSIYGIFPEWKITSRLRLRDVGEVRGRILDREGRPIGGAAVKPIQFGKVHIEHQFVEPTYLPPEVAGRYETKTASDGSFIVRGVPIGYRLLADIRAEGHAHVTLDWNPATPLEMRLPPPGVVAGRIIDGPPGARVGRELMLVAAERPQPLSGRLEASAVYRQQTTKADSEGRFRFDAVAPGQYELKSADPEIGAHYFDSAKIQVKPDSSTVVDLALKPARKLRGRVVDQAGNAVPGATVSFVRLTDPRFFSGQPIAQVDSESVSGPDGSYEGYVIPADRLRAQINKLPNGFARGDSGQVTVEEDPAAPLRPLIVEKVEPLIVRVTDENGQPVSGAQIRALGAATFFPNGPPKPSGADGIVKLLFADRGEMATLYVVAGDAVGEPLTIDPAEERGPLTISVSPKNAFRFHGQVVDRTGKPLSGVEVPVIQSVRVRSKRNPQIAGSGGQIETLMTDSDGRFTAGPFVPCDQYAVHIREDGYRRFQSAMVDAKNGTTRDFGRIVLQRVDAVVRGRVVDAGGSPLAGARVVNSGDAPTRLVTKTAADGSFELRGLAAGTVHVVAFKDDLAPARIAIDTEKNQLATLTMQQRNAATPDGIDDAAVRAAAKQVLEKLWEWPDARKSPVDQKVVALMARLDPQQARRWSGKTTPDEPTIEQLVESDLDEALAQLATRDADAACREMKRLAEKFSGRDKAKAQRLADEMAVRARSTDPRHRLFRISDAGRLLAQLGRSDAGKKLIQEAAAQAEKLSTSDSWNRYARGHVASRLAPFDLHRAKRLLEGVNIPEERGRYAVMCANALAASDPKAAAEMLELVEMGYQRDARLRTASYLMALTNLLAAEQLLDSGEGSSYIATGYGWLAMAVAPQDKHMAHRMIDRGFAAIHERSSTARGWHSFGGWGEAAGVLALYAAEVDYPNRADLAAHVFAERPTVADVSSESAAIQANLGLAILLAPIDRAAARTLLDIAESSKGVIGNGHSLMGRREYLAAWGLIDPPHSVSLLLAEIETLRTAGRGLPERGGLLDVLDLMTKPADDRRRAIARFLTVGWPDPEEIE